MQTRIQKPINDAAPSKKSGNLLADTHTTIKDERSQTAQLKTLQTMMSNSAPLQKFQSTMNTGDREPSTKIETSSEIVGPAQGGIVQGYWDVACKPGKIGNMWYLSKIVIKDRPPIPETQGMTQHGGKSFHHESPWNFIERQVRQFEGVSIDETVNYLVTNGLTGGQWPRMLPPPDNEQLTKLAAINEYFHSFLKAKAAEASGWLGPTDTHASQGGKISAALKALKSQGFSKHTIDHALTVSFEPAPDLNEKGLSQAAEEHADMFYAAFQLFLEENDNVSIQDHEVILDILRDWTTKYWVEPTDY